jgi:multimeric flavodoxin WrbA
MKVPLVILGTARSESNTRELVARVLADLPHTLIDLAQHSIAPYNYNQDYTDSDAFLPIANQMLAHQSIVFATPVYWYSMSGELKHFFDRLTDLTGTHKALGRLLVNKKIYLLASGSDSELPLGFEVPFQRTAQYFHMRFTSTFYQSTQQPYHETLALIFRQQLCDNQ